MNQNPYKISLPRGGDRSPPNILPEEEPHPNPPLAKGRRPESSPTTCYSLSHWHIEPHRKQHCLGAYQ